MTRRRSFSKAFKLEAVRLAASSGNTAQPARELGVKADLIRRWRKRIEEDGRRAFPGYGKPRDEELARLITFMHLLSLRAISLAACFGEVTCKALGTISDQ